MGPVRTCLWFNGNGAEAARFYTSLIPGSGIEGSPEEGTEPMIVQFHLAGVPYVALNGGDRYAPTPAASIMVSTHDQAETDALWSALTADGGEESMCGWCVDRFGISWQVIPDALPRLMSGPDRAGAERAMNAMLTMRKIDIAALEAAYAGS